MYSECHFFFFWHNQADHLLLRALWLHCETTHLPLSWNNFISYTFSALEQTLSYLNFPWHRLSKVLETSYRDFSPSWHDVIAKMLQIHRLCSSHCRWWSLRDGHDQQQYSGSPALLHYRWYTVGWIHTFHIVYTKFWSCYLNVRAKI